jgi:hypothetical protein
MSANVDVQRLPAGGDWPAKDGGHDRDVLTHLDGRLSDLLTRPGGFRWECAGITRAAPLA